MSEIHESGEDYLEAILVLKKENGVARSVDVAKHLGVSKPSVSRAMGILMENGYVILSSIGSLELTEKGKEKAQSIYSRHILLTKFLQVITGVSEEQAEANACRIEHDIDDDIKVGIEKWMEKNGGMN
ncbi:MAG: metal-dependent transcriptional regulator [Treponema sp.]|nr:metal-dependent transcriptional regulator [Treponema sp.]